MDTAGCRAVALAFFLPDTAPSQSATKADTGQDKLALRSYRPPCGNPDEGPDKGPDKGFVHDAFQSDHEIATHTDQMCILETVSFQYKYSYSDLHNGESSFELSG